MEKPTPITKEYVKYLASLNTEQVEFVKKFSREEKDRISELFDEMIADGETQDIAMD